MIEVFKACVYIEHITSTIADGVVATAMYNVCLRNPQRTHRHKQIEHKNLKGYCRLLLVHSKTDWEHLAGHFHE